MSRLRFAEAGRKETSGFFGAGEMKKADSDLCHEHALALHNRTFAGKSLQTNISCFQAVTLNLVVQCQSFHLDETIAALSDATLRGIIDELAKAACSVTTLADKFQVSLTGLKKHIQVLERRNLVATKKSAA